MKSLILALLPVIFFTETGCSQTGPGKQVKDFTLITVGDDCEGCEAIYESPVKFEQLSSLLTLPGFEEAGPKIEISGTIYERDGRTPAPGIILYVYHTDQKGIYATKGNETGWAKRHGYIRGWLKTDGQGQYKIRTLVPASYPNSNNPKHIHPIIKEPGKTAYWIDEFLFADDPYLDAGEKARKNPRGGSGILNTNTQNGRLFATRNITLGLNIPNYPLARHTGSLDNRFAGTTDSPGLIPYIYPGLIRESIYLGAAYDGSQIMR